MLYTNLNLLRKALACSDGMTTLQASLTPLHLDDSPISLAHILKSNGLDNAIWALRATTVDSRKFTACFAIECATASLVNFEKVYPEDNRPREAVEAASAFMEGKITLAQLEAARSAAWSARSPRSAAWSPRSARSARSAAWSAWLEWSVGKSPTTAARSAAESAARSAESAARSAAESAWLAWLAWSAAWSAAESAARSAAWSAARSAQTDMFLKMLEATPDA